jgi:peptidyl-tRNA hydrolase
MTATDYVLGKFTEQERTEFELVVAKAADAVEQWARDGIAATMNAVNARPAVDE